MKNTLQLKRIIAVGLLSVVLGSWFYAYANLTTLIGGYANDPKASNCTSCHTGVKLFSHKGAILLHGTSVSGANLSNGYGASSDTFRMQLAYPKSDVGTGHCYGMQITAIDSSTGAALGTMFVTDTANTKMTTKLVGGKYLRTYINHSKKSSVAAAGKTWNFDWVPPKTSGGTVAFFVCVLSGDNNGKVTGNDTTWSDTFYFRPKAAALAAKFTYSPSTPCVNSSVSFKDTSVGTVKHYSWLFKDGTVSATDTNKNPKYTFTTTSNDSAILTITDAKGTKSTYKSAITVLPAPVPVISASPTGVCKYGDSVLLKCGTWKSVSWSNGSTADSIYVKDTSKSYTVTVTNANGCSGSGTPFKLKVSASIPGPSLAVNDTFLCSAGSVTFTAGTGFSYYTFMDGATILALKQTSNVLTFKFSSGTHKITVTGISSSGCSSLASTAVRVTVSNPISIGLTNSGASGSVSSAYCGKDMVTLTASPSTLASYNFYQNKKLIYTGKKNTYSFSASLISSGDVFTVKGTNSGGCSDSLSTGLPLSYAADLTPSFGWVDTKGNVSFVDSTTGAVSAYTWDFGDKSKMDTTASPKHSYKAGSYQVKLTVTNASGCTYSETKTLAIVISAIQVPQSISSFSAYPIPTKEKLFIHVNSEDQQNVEFTLIDLNGKMVFSKKATLVAGDNMVSIDINNIMPGSYILQLKGKENISSIKVSKME